MTRFHTYSKAFGVRSGIWALLVVLCSSTAALAADSISGTARNQTQGRPAAGDDVILLRLDQGMQEETRAKTDGQGSFTVKVQSPDKPYLVRIVHQGVNYDQQASAGNTVAIDVFDAAPKVQGVNGSIEILRAGTQDNTLHVSDMMEIKNESQPPITQAGERTLEVYLPAKAKLDSVFASGAGKLPVVISASPVPGEAGHYTVSFPLRPGSTQFAFNYNLPYDGRVAFRPRHAYAFRQMAVMIPPTMKFTSNSSAFKPLSVGNPAFKVQAASQLDAGAAPEFELSGSGAVPGLQARSQSQPRTAMPPGTNPGQTAAQPALPPATSSNPQTPVQGGLRGASRAPVPPAAASSPREWWILGGASILVVGTFAFMVWRARRRSGAIVKPGSSATPLIEALKQELLELETSRVQGSISGEEYDKAKQALDGTMQRALARAAAKP
jgi:hypothetical protein